MSNKHVNNDPPPLIPRSIYKDDDDDDYMFPLKDRTHYALDYDRGEEEDDEDGQDGERIPMVEIVFSNEQSDVKRQNIEIISEDIQHDSFGIITNEDGVYYVTRCLVDEIDYAPFATTESNVDLLANPTDI